MRIYREYWDGEKGRRDSQCADRRFAGSTYRPWQSRLGWQTVRGSGEITLQSFDKMKFRLNPSARLPDPVFRHG